MAGIVLEGTWEEIISRAPELAGKRVRLVILPEAGAAKGPSPGVPVPQGTLAEALAGLTGIVRSRDYTGEQLRLSEDETSFGESLELKRREGVT